MGGDPMTAEQLLDDGRLVEAIAQQEKEVMARPDDLAGRTFLFELLGFAGELDLAEKQLGAIERLDLRPEAQTGLQTYRGLLEAERARTRLFEAGSAPQFFAEPSPAIALHLEAIDLCRSCRDAEARTILARAASFQQERRIMAGGSAIDRIRDADDLLGPILEVITAAGYFWVSWDDVQLLLVPPPKDFRDLLWTPARLATHDGLLGEVYLPNLYSFSYRHPDEAVRLGRATIWNDTGSGIIRGAGQKLFLVGEDDYRTLMEIGEIQFLPESDGSMNPGQATEEFS
jgi:type VI secretion system protein ImpE